MYVIPERKILSNKDMNNWFSSSAYKEYIEFVEIINKSVTSKSNSSKHERSDSVNGIMDILKEISQIIDKTPPTNQPQRFGNKAFKTFHDKLKENSSDLIKKYTDFIYHPSIIEIAPYLLDSFGNEIRIDYGTGHEMNFVVFMLCLVKINLLSKKDFISIAIDIFSEYMNIIRKLQTIYKMEPAGSHGVWSLDDYQFLPFLWGSSQLIGNEDLIKPSSFPDQLVAQANANDYMFMAAINYINQVKSGPFSEHSNKLWNISGVTDWHKINIGLLKMYKVEVLSKFPVVQHLMFGTLFSFNPVKPS